MGKINLGEKLTCSSCEARFYDLNKTPALCPKCGAENKRPKVTKSKKVEAAPIPEKATPKPADNAAGDGDDNIEDLEGDEEDDLIPGDDDDDDDVEAVIGPIPTDGGSDV
ncbi:MAG: FYDLN acid domain-containing protein [Rhodospirillales bacterium]